MCGFAGLVLHDPRSRPDRELLRTMAATLVHRGPDEGRELLLGQGGLAFRRLAIIDVAGGSQPLTNEAGDVAAVANGEIYNFEELRRGLAQRGHQLRSRSDSEVIPHLYEELGAELVGQLTGMLAFAVLDSRGGRTRLLLGRDRLGIKPLFYSEGPEGIAFASEAKALLAGEWVARELRPEALLDYLVQGYCGGEQSAWSGIKRLPPGSVLEWEPGGVARVRRYWDLPLEQLGPPVAPAEILQALDASVSERLVSDVPLGAFLSGGIDSTAVVSSMALQRSQPVVACSVGFHERSHDELGTASATARSLGALHHTELLEADPRLALETLPWFFDEPLADPSTVPTYLVSRMAREHVTVALSGDGGDETFAGYRRYVHDYAENWVRRSLGPRGSSFVGALGRAFPRLERGPQFLRGRSFLTNIGDDPARGYWRSVTQMERGEALALLNPELSAHLRDHDPHEAFRAHYERPLIDCPLYRAQYADFHTYLPDQILTKVDRASMGVSLEVRVPLLDHRFVERFAPLPAASKVRRGKGKWALRDALRERIPAAVLEAPKRGFDTPLRGWLRGPLGESVGEAIETIPEDWFDRGQLRSALERHRAGSRDHSRMLWSLLVLEHWRRRHAVQRLAS